MWSAKSLTKDRLHYVEIMFDSYPLSEGRKKVQFSDQVLFDYGTGQSMHIDR